MYAPWLNFNLHSTWQATEERRHMYSQIMQRTEHQSTDHTGHGRTSAYKAARLSTKDTFKLYKTFMGLAEGDEGAQVIFWLISFIVWIIIFIYLDIYNHIKCKVLKL